jgi:pimeloyl-ACP methyl ester carboxylesterase
VRRRVVLGVVVAVLVIALIGGIGAGVLSTVSRPPAPTSTPVAEATWPTPAAIRWGTCSDTELKAAEAECASVTVPMDWSAPRNGKTVRLAISRVRHTRTPFAGVMLVNPGGPGGSGLALATTGSKVPNGAGARYDWIGFDPRGVGASRPRLTCDADYANGPRPAYTPATDASVRAWSRLSEGYAKDCARNGDLLAHMTTRDAANDMDYLRIALGVARISFYGYSYGTYLGQVYATLYPTHLGRMVLDSTVDPTRVWYGANLDQDLAFEKAIDVWFDWLAKHDGTYGLGTTRAAVEAQYTRLGARLAKDPAGGVFGSAELADTLLYAGYSQSLWPDLAGAFASAVNGDTQLARSYWKALNETTDDNGYAAYLAVECTDQVWPGEESVWLSDARRTAEDAPFETWANTWFNAPCRTWPAKAGAPVDVDGAAAPPVLMIDETLDAATPYAGSLVVRKLFPKASLLAEPGGTSHADSLNGNACVDDAVAAYLADGTGR